jgi:hypothetical protein
VLGCALFKLSELKLGELLDTPPPGLDEAMAISKVYSFSPFPFSVTKGSSPGEGVYLCLVSGG